MKPKILIIGSTGKLGIKLLDFCKKKQINIFCITGYNNDKLLKSQSIKYNIKHSFKLSDTKNIKSFKIFLKKNKIDLIYFLDFGHKSLLYADIFLQNNYNSQIAIANKEIIIAGGENLINKITSTKNILTPLDSEHFSLSKSYIKNENIQKIYITASGGPFYFRKNINLNKVKLKTVLKHPKWKMGINNSIDSSNFVNKILEIFELSIIFKIDLKKIDFLVSKEAYVHSVILTKDNIVNINCFNNDMLISLINPLLKYYPSVELSVKKLFLKKNMFKMEKFYDKRFRISNYLNTLKNLSPNRQILFMILNNIAQNKYLSNEIKYNEIVDFIMNNLYNNNKYVNFKSIRDRLKFINNIESKYGM